MKTSWTLLIRISCAAGIAQSNGSFSKTFEKPHQLRDIAFELQLVGWPVSFEEGPLSSEAELIQRMSPTGIPVLVKKVVPMHVDLSATELAATDNKARIAVLERIFSSYAALGNRDTYGVRSSGKYLEVTPREISSSSGGLVQVTPVLDTKISFPEQRFGSLQGFVSFVINEVSRLSGVSIVLGNTPTNMFRHSSVMEVALNEPAREVLGRAFGAINGPRLAEGLSPVALPWTLTYDPMDNQYWFAVSAVALPSYGGVAYTNTPPPTGNNESHKPPLHTIRPQ